MQVQEQGGGRGIGWVGIQGQGGVVKNGVVVVLVEGNRVARC